MVQSGLPPLDGLWRRDRGRDVLRLRGSDAEPSPRSSATQVGVHPEMSRLHQWPWQYVGLGTGFRW